MFARDQKKIAEYAQASPENMARVLKFVILTIRVRLSNVCADMATLDDVVNVDESGILYGWKPRGIADIDNLIGEIYPQVCRAFAAAATAREAANDILPLFLQITGLGLVKAGFAAQLCFGVSGCLDTHNVTQYGVNPNLINSKRYKGLKTLAGRARAVDRYNSLCDELGGTRALWDNWCNYVAARSPDLYRDGAHVSSIHCEALGL